MLKTEEGPHGFAYDPYNNVIYDVNHPNGGETNGGLNWLLDYVGLTDGRKSYGYKFNMNKKKNRDRFLSFGGGRDELMLAPITVSDPSVARAFFQRRILKRPPVA